LDLVDEEIGMANGLQAGDARPVGDGVTDNRHAGHYALAVEGATAVAEYRIEDGRIVFTHTRVPPTLEGRGVGRRLMLAALADADAAGLEVVADCWFVAKVLAARG